MGTSGVASRTWACGWVLVGWATLAGGACGGSTAGAPSPTPTTTGGDSAGGPRDRDDTAGPAGGKQPRAGAGSGATAAGGTGAGMTAGAGGLLAAGGGQGGSAGAGGSSPGGAGGSRLGRACETDAECQAAAEPDLTCVTATSTVLGNGAPPLGLCSRRCVEDDECSAHSAGALCYPLGLSDSYCVEGCQFGSPEVGETKCHSRPELACNPALLSSTGDVCQSNDDCQTGELCKDGTCNVVFAGCLPACRGDIDCAVGMYCDQSFLGGLCRTNKATGQRLGEPCTVPAANQPSEPDGCLGFCQPDSTNGTQGHCATTCALGQQCAWDAASRRFDGMCLYGSALTAETGGTGDFGFCTPTCNCSEQCNDPTLSCQLLDQAPLDEGVFKGAGLCFETDAASQPFDECGSGGSDNGGTGPISSAGAGGVGAGGAP